MRRFAGALGLVHLLLQPVCQDPANGVHHALPGPPTAHVDARYEALTFRLANAHRYTPDWVVLGSDGRIECHEVKGAYRFGSHGRARLAFDQAKVEFPGFGWVWATWTGKTWEVQR